MFSLCGARCRVWVKTGAFPLFHEKQSCYRVDLDSLVSSLVRWDFVHDCTSLFLNAPFGSNLVIPQPVWLRKQVFSWKETINQHNDICVSMNVA